MYKNILFVLKQCMTGYFIIVRESILVVCEGISAELEGVSVEQAGVSVEPEVDSKYRAKGKQPLLVTLHSSVVYMRAFQLCVHMYM